MQNARLDDFQAGIKITRRNINNFRYADETTLMTESEDDQHRNMYNIYSETDHQPRLDAWDKCSGLVHWENPEGSGRVGGGWGDRDGEYM